MDPFTGPKINHLDRIIIVANDGREIPAIVLSHGWSAMCLKVRQPDTGELGEVHADNVAEIRVTERYVRDFNRGDGYCEESGERRGLSLDDASRRQARCRCGRVLNIRPSQPDSNGWQSATLPKHQPAKS